MSKNICMCTYSSDYQKETSRDEIYIENKIHLTIQTLFELRLEHRTHTLDECKYSKQIGHSNQGRYIGTLEKYKC